MSKPSATTSLPFGTAIADNAAVDAATANRRFTDYERNPRTGLDYAINRFYDRSIGRFIQPDPAGIAAMTMSDPQTFNIYAYARNDPVNHTNSLGLQFVTGCIEVNGQSQGCRTEYFLEWVPYAQKSTISLGKVVEREARVAVKSVTTGT